MLITESLILFIVLLLVIGAFAGIIAGLLGVGGGIVIVPALYLMLTYIGLDEAIIMHVAVGTSLATIIFTSLRSVMKHREKGAVDAGILRHWSPWLFVGAIAGIAIAAIVSTQVLAGVFAIIALGVAVQMTLGRSERVIAEALPKGIGGALLPTVIATLSTLMGIGGGTLGVPTLTLFGVPIHRAVATSAGFGVVIAIPATIGFIFNGWSIATLPPYSLGYVNLIGFAIIVPATFLTVPLGVSMAHWLKPDLLRKAFALFLAFTASRMLWDIFT